jgi:DNA-binding response OmpR family regulator
LWRTSTRVLIAEDDPVSRMVLQETLVGFGYEVVACSDGSQAWDALHQENPPELAVLDWMMPGVDGVELCRRVRQSASPSSIYIILLTIKGRREDVIEGLHAGADDYVTKPFDAEEFRARVRVGQRIVELQRQRLEQATARYVQQLERTVEELRESRARLVVAQEEVRRAIAEELHGNVQTHMCILYMKLQDIQSRMADSPPEIQSELAQITDELDNLRENEIRQLSHRLHPGIIRMGLAAGLRSLRDQYERHIPIALEIDEQVSALEPAGGSNIPFNIRLGLYRVAEEALGNVVKHSGAGRARVRLAMSDSGNTLRLSIEDNGRGFAPDAERKPSLGLATIQDYMGAIGGVFELDTAPGMGTRITAVVHLDAEQPHKLV